MLKYIYIIMFLMTHDLTQLKTFWQSELIKSRRFSWLLLIIRLKNLKQSRYKYLFWFRLINEMYINGNKKQRKIAVKLNQKLINKYNIEIGLGAKIGKGLNLTHLSAIVITGYIEIGDYFTVKQNTTIGVLTTKESHGIWKDNYKIVIGNNVFIGANSCIIGDNLTIGDNVVIGAMSFINKDIPDNCTVYTEKTNKIVYR